MPVDYIESSANTGAMQDAKDTWTSNNTYSSIDNVDGVPIGRDRVVQIITYTA